MSTIVALDTGAILGLAHYKRDIVALIKGLMDNQHFMVVPAPVLAETLRGTPATDANIHKWLKAFTVAPINGEIAKAAGYLIGRTRTNHTVDAMIVAAAVALGATTLVTGDLLDMQRLAGSSLELLEI
jgi:predicted nucleic acid-binding protein